MEEEEEEEEEREEEFITSGVTVEEEFIQNRSRARRDC